MTTKVRDKGLYLNTCGDDNDGGGEELAKTPKVTSSVAWEEHTTD